MYRPNKRSAHYYASHNNDIYTDLGFDYHGSILKKTLSPVIFRNIKTRAILEKVEDIVCYLIDSVKQVKLHYMFSLNKKDININ